jgi:hypothetical protein
MIPKLKNWLKTIFNEHTNNTIQNGTHVSINIGVYLIEGCNLKKPIVVHVLCLFSPQFLACFFIITFFVLVKLFHF